jgi:hypothetical protein
MTDFEDKRPLVVQRQERVEALVNWASSQPNVTSSITTGNVSTATYLVSNYAVTTFNVSSTTATNYAHVVVATLSSTLGNTNRVPY